MGFLIVIAGAIVGAILGGTVGNDATTALGFFSGLAIGLAFAWLRRLAARITILRGEIDALKREATASVRLGQVVTPIGAQPVAPAPSATTQPQTADIDLTTDVGNEMPAASPPPALSIPSPRIAVQARPNPIERAGAWLKRWFSEGNVPVKVGMLCCSPALPRCSSTRPTTPWRRWLLWEVLVAAAALVGGFALSLLRGARRGESDSPVRHSGEGRDPS